MITLRKSIPDGTAVCMLIMDLYEDVIAQYHMTPARMEEYTHRENNLHDIFIYSSMRTTFALRRMPTAFPFSENASLYKSITIRVCMQKDWAVMTLIGFVYPAPHSVHRITLTITKPSP